HPEGVIDARAPIDGAEIEHRLVERDARPALLGRSQPGREDERQARTPPSPHAPSSVRKRSRYALVTPPATKRGSRTMRRWRASVVGGSSLRNSSSQTRCTRV